MDQRNYPVPGTRHSVVVDLDDRDKLTDTETNALSAAFLHRIAERERLNEEIRKITKRLVLSGELKVERREEEEDNAP